MKAYIFFWCIKIISVCECSQPHGYFFTLKSKKKKNLQCLELHLASDTITKQSYIYLTFLHHWKMLIIWYIYNEMTTTKRKSCCPVWFYCRRSMDQGFAFRLLHMFEKCSFAILCETSVTLFL